MSESKESVNGNGIAPPDFADEIEQMESKAKAELEEEAAAIARGDALSAKEEREPYRITINGRVFEMPSLLEWTFEQDEAVLEVLEPLLPVIGPFFQHGLTYGEMLTMLPQVIDALVRERLHRKLLGVVLVPEGCEFDRSKCAEIEEAMRGAKNVVLRDVVRRFFTTGDA